MGKRGPKPYKAGERLMPIRTTAERLGLDPRTVEKIWSSAVLKLGGNLFIEEPKACDIVLANVYAMDASEHDPLQCGSIECRHERIELFGGLK